MSGPSHDTQSRLQAIADKHGVSVGAAETLLRALVSGGGGMAQFSHPELGGMGQWSPGMTMVGDMFNSGLKTKVEALCNDLVPLVRDGASAAAAESGGKSGGSSWWPSELGTAASSGGQNDWRYAYFPNSRRLAVQRDGQVRVYDTGDNVISGASQQQGTSQSLSFSTATGTVGIEDLREVH